MQALRRAQCRFGRAVGIFNGLAHGFSLVIREQLARLSHCILWRGPLSAFNGPSRPHRRHAGAAPYNAARCSDVAAVAHARAMRVRRREQPERRGGARGQPRGASKPRPLFAFSNNGRAEFCRGASRASATSPRRLPGSGCVVSGLCGHATLHGRKWPFWVMRATRFAARVGAFGGRGVAGVRAGARACACGAGRARKELACRDTLALPSLELVLRAKTVRRRAPNHPQPAHVSRVPEKSPRSPGHRLAAARLAGRAKRARRRFRARA